jgi:hypothetical protein
MLYVVLACVVVDINLIALSACYPFQGFIHNAWETAALYRGEHHWRGCPALPDAAHAGIVR